MDRVAFRIGDFEVYWYAIMIVTGMLLGMLAASALLKRKGYKSDLVIDLAILVLPLAIVGARLYYVLFTLDRNWTFAEIIDIRSGGLAIYGGVIGGAAGVLIACAVKKFNFKNILDMMDAIAPGLILGQAIGRWGNFFNQEAYGNPVTDPNLQFFPYAVYIESEGGHFQATFFYESFCNIIGFALLFLLAYRLKGRYKGLVTCAYFVYYGIVRSVIEGLRSDSLYIGAIRASQLLSIILIVVGLALGAYIVLREKGIVKVRKNIQK